MARRGSQVWMGRASIEVGRGLHLEFLRCPSIQQLFRFASVEERKRGRGIGLRILDATPDSCALRRPRAATCPSGRLASGAGKLPPGLLACQSASCLRLMSTCIQGCKTLEDRFRARLLLALASEQSFSLDAYPWHSIHFPQQTGVALPGHARTSPAWRLSLGTKSTEFAILSKRHAGKEAQR